MLLRLDSGARRLLRLLPREYAYTGAELALLGVAAWPLWLLFPAGLSSI